MKADNQRQEPRLARDDAIHIQVRQGATVPPQSALVLHVNTRDISASGFNAACNMALTHGTVLDVVIELRGDGKPFLLTAEVRWCKPHPDGGYAAGFVITDAIGSDYEAWRSHF